MRGMGLKAADMQPAKVKTTARVASKTKGRKATSRKPAAKKKPAPTVVKRKATKSS